MTLTRGSSSEPRSALSMAKPRRLYSSQWRRGREGIVIFHQIHDKGMSRQYRETLSVHTSQGSGASNSAEHVMLPPHYNFMSILSMAVRCTTPTTRSSGFGPYFFKKFSELLGAIFSSVQSHRASAANAVYGLSRWLAEKSNLSSPASASPRHSSTTSTTLTSSASCVAT